MPTLILLAVMAIVPHAPVVEDRVDLIEVNHFYDDNGRLVFDQAILWDWCNKAERFQIVAWRLVKPFVGPPQADLPRGGYVVIWQDGDRLRRVRAEYIRETWTQHDPELTERNILPREERKELGR